MGPSFALLRRARLGVGFLITSIKEKEVKQYCFDATDAFEITEGRAGAVQDASVFYVADRGARTIHHPAIVEISNYGSGAVLDLLAIKVSDGRSRAVQDTSVFDVSDGAARTIHHSPVLQVTNRRSAAIHQSLCLHG